MIAQVECCDDALVLAGEALFAKLVFG